jgi:Bifunctional DNA primase/polymerase, N-terminal/Protein of unknown function (DUF3987)
MTTRKESILHRALKYTSWGWRVIPVPEGEKAPRIKNWQNLRIRRSEVAEHFSEENNIGVLLGKWPVDVDLDCKEAIFLARQFLPATKRIHGRKSKPDSHFWYRTSAEVKPQKFCDVNGSVLVELRGAGQQTMVPPSIHPSGQRLRWSKNGKAGRVQEAELRMAVSRLAAAAIVARHWPAQGSRNEAAKALAGTLLRAGCSEIEAGEFVGAVAKAANDEEWQQRKVVARTTQKRLNSEKDATGRPRLTELLGADVVDRMCGWLGIGSPAVPDDHVELVQTWPKALSNRAMHGLAGDFVRAVSPITEADEPGLLLQFLAVFGNAAGRSARFCVGHSEHRANLYVVLVGRTARARKGTSWAEVEHVFELAAPVWAHRCLLPGGLASGEGLIWAVRDATEKKVKPPKGSKQDQDVLKTIDPGIQDKRLLVLETEFASPLRIIRREGNILSTVIRRAWEKGNLSNLSKHSAARATGAHISIIGHITREELKRELSASEGSNGFANRILWLCVRRSKLLPLGGQLSEETSRRLIRRLQRALVCARKVGEMRFTKQAEKLWCKVYTKLSADVPGLFGAVTSRAEPQVLRLSMVYALLDSTMFINRKHLRAALAVWRYCERSARYIFGDALGGYVADTILRGLRGVPHGLTRTQINALFHRNRSERDISDGLRVLLEYGLVRCVREETGGRPSERWTTVQ